VRHVILRDVPPLQLRPGRQTHAETVVAAVTGALIECRAATRGADGATVRVSAAMHA